MGCIQSKNVITGVDGDETAYLSRFLEDRVLGEGEFGQVREIVIVIYLVFTYTFSLGTSSDLLDYCAQTW